MALHPKFPDSPYAILNPAIRWYPVDEVWRKSNMEKIMPHLLLFPFDQIQGRGVDAVPQSRGFRPVVKNVT
jgi:hypothetical protein